MTLCVLPTIYWFPPSTVTGLERERLEASILPCYSWMLRLSAKEMYPESFLDTKVRKLCEHKICQDFLRIAMGSIPGQVTRSIAPFTKISFRQKLSRRMDVLCGSKSAKQKRMSPGSLCLSFSPNTLPRAGVGGRAIGGMQFPVFLQQLHEDYKYLSWLYSFTHSNESSRDERPEICWDEINVNWNRKWILAPTTMSFRRQV